MASLQNGTEQVARLPVRKLKDGDVEILLMTSREKGKWLISRGWPCRR